MRIGIVYDAAYPFTKGGAQLRYFDQALELVRRGHTIIWFTAKQWDGQDVRRDRGIEYRAISPAGPAYVAGRRSIPHAVRFGLDSFRILPQLRDFDVLDVGQYPFFHLVPILLFARILNLPTTTTWYEYWGAYWYEYLGRLGLLGRGVEWIAARMSPRIVAISESTRNRLVQAGIDREKIYYLPNFIDVHHLRGIRPHPDKYDVCYFGRLKAQKNVHSLIEALGICDSRGVELRTKIIGDGPSRDQLEELTKSLDLQARVSFVGEVEDHDDLLALVKASRLFVNPSIKEGGGSIVSIEANAVGVPVVAFACSMGLDSGLIAHGENGLWVNDVSAEGLADTIEEFFSYSMEEQEQMSCSAQLRAEELDILNAVDRLESYYRALSQSTGP